MQGERLRRIREEMGISQEDLGERLGLGNRQIWRYENNETRPSSEIVASIAKSLNVSADFLLGLSDDPIPYLTEQGLSENERRVITAWRRKDYIEAMKLIVLDAASGKATPTL
jgi:transcriptional regulator with XRE-family HTH domain